MNTNKSLQPLSSHILPPTRRLLPAGSMIAIALALVTVGSLSLAAMLGHSLVMHPPAQPSVQLIVMNKAPPERPEPTSLAATEPLPDTQKTPADAHPVTDARTTAEPVEPLPRNSEYALVFEFDGHTYVAIDTVDKPDPWAEGPMPADVFPRHGALRVVGDPEFPSGVIASMQAADLDADVAAWQGHPLFIDNRCAGQVEDFALISLISGEPLAYLGPFDKPGQGGLQGDLARALLRFGNTIIAGRVPQCGKKTSGVARSASLPVAIPAMVLTDDELVATAKDRFLSSKMADNAQRAFVENGLEGAFWRSEPDSLQTRVFRHPQTGQTLISIHAVVDYGCGGTDINLWGLYEVDATGEVRERQLIDAQSILGVGEAIDIDGDGTFEFTAHDAGGDPALITMDGEILRVLESPFYGCSC